MQLHRHFIVGQGSKLQGDAGVLLPECFQHLPQIGQIVRNQCHADAQPQWCRLDVLISLLAQGIELLHHRRSLCPEPLTLFSKSQMIAVVDKQLAAKLFFQCSNAQPQGLPGQIHPPGGVGVIQIFAQCQKIAQLLDGHDVLLFTKRKFYLILIRILYLLFLCL